MAQLGIVFIGEIVLLASAACLRFSVLAKQNDARAETGVW